MSDEKNIRFKISAVSEIPDVNNQLEEFIKLQRAVVQQIAIQTGEMRTQSEAQIKAIGGATDALNKQRTTIKQNGDEAKASFDELNKKVRDFTTLVATAFTFHEIKSFGMDVIEAKTKIDSLKIALDVMLGSKRESADLFNQIVDLAKKTPFSLDEVAENVVKLKAYNIANKDLIPTVEALGNISAAVGKEKLPQLTLAYGQVINMGKLMGQETKQFIEAGVPLYDLLADSMKKPKEEVIKLAQNHQIMAADVQKAIMQTSEVGGRYYNMMQLQSQTLGGQVSNLADSFFVAKARIGDFFEDGLKGGIKILADFIDKSAGSHDAIKKTTTYIASAVTALTTWKLATNAQAAAVAAKTVVMQGGQLIMGTYNAAMIAAKGSTEGFTQAQVASATAARGTWAALAANPIGAVVAVVGLATSAYLAWKAASVEVSEAMGEQQYQIEKEQAELNRLADTAMKAKEGTQQRRDAINALIAKYPEYFSGIDAEKVSNNQLNAILKDVNKSYEIRSKVAQEAYRLEKAAGEQRKLWDEQAESIKRLVERVPELEKFGNDTAAILKYLNGNFEAFKKARGGRNALTDLFVGDPLENLLTVDKNLKELDGKMKGYESNITKYNKESLSARVKDTEAHYRVLIEQAAGNKKEQERLQKELNDKIDEINGTARNRELKTNQDFNEKKKQQISATAIEIMRINAQTGEKSLEDQLKLAELEQKLRIENINKLELSEKEKAARIKKVINETQPGIDALKAELQIKSVSATNIAIEKLEAQSGEQRLKDQMRLLDLKEKAEIEAINKSKILYAEKEKQISDTIAKYEQQRGDLRKKIDAEILEELFQKQQKHHDRIKVLTTERLAAEKILEEVTTAQTQEQRLAIVQKYGKQTTDEVRKYAIEQLKLNLDAAQKHLDQVKTTEEEKSKVYQSALKRRDDAEAKYETARTQQAKEDANRYVKLVAETEAKVQELRKQTTEQERENLEKQNQFRQNAIKSIIDLFGQGSPIISGFAGMVLSALNNIDSLSGKTQQQAEERLSGLKKTLEHLEILQSSSLNRSREEIEKTRVRIDQTKLDITKTQGVIDETQMKAFEASMGIFAMAFQVAKAIADTYNQMMTETYQAIADGYARTREVMTDIHDTMIRLSRESLDLELEDFKGSYEEKEKLINEYYAKEFEFAEGRDRLDAQLAHHQQMAQIRADAGGNIRKFLAALEAAQYDQLVREEAMKIASIERDLVRQRELRDNKIEALKQEFDAFKALKESEISEAEKARDAKADILKAELEAFKQTRQAEIDALNESLKQQREATNQFYSDKQLRLQQDDVYRKELLEAGEAREVAALEAAKQRELDRAASADERTRILNAFEALIAETHNKYQTAVGDKTKEISLANQEVKAQEADKIQQMEKATNDLIAKLKDEMAAKDKEVQDQIKRNQEETTAIINQLKEQIAQKDKEINDQMTGANSAYKEAVKAAQREIFEAEKAMAIAELRAEIAKLRGKNHFLGIGAGKTREAIEGLEAAIGEIMATGFKDGTEYVDKDGKHKPGIDTVPAMLTKGERVLTVAQNKELGGISNDELVKRATLYDKMMTQLQLSEILGSTLRLPDGITTPSGNQTIDLSGLRSDMKDLKKVIQNKSEVHINVDKNGFHLSQRTLQRKANYYQNLFNH